MFYLNNSFDRISILLKIFFSCYLANGLCVQQNKIESFYHMQGEKSCEFPCVQTSFSQKLLGYQECVSVKYIKEIKLAVIIAVKNNLSNCLEPWKIQGFKRDWAHDLTTLVRHSSPLSFEATENWGGQLGGSIPMTGEIIGGSCMWNESYSIYMNCGYWSQISFAWSSRWIFQAYEQMQWSQLIWLL